MDRKDLVLFLLIFILANKNSYSKDLLSSFRDDVYSFLSDIDDFTMFKLRFLTYSLAYDEQSFQLRREFIDFLTRIYKVYNS